MLLYSNHNFDSDNLHIFEWISLSSNPKLRKFSYSNVIYPSFNSNGLPIHSGIDIVVPCLVIPPFLEMKSDEHFRGMIRAWNETGRLKPLVPLVFFGENFNDLKELAKKEEAPVFYTPTEAAYAIKVL